MADFWIKVEKGTPDKPEILELSAILNIEDPDTVTGKLIRVWSWFDSNSENGHAPLVTKVLLDRLTGVTGLTDALVTVGWLNKTDTGYSVNNFDRHLGKGAKKRASDAERKRKSRDKSQQCHNKSVTSDVTEIGLDKSRVDKSKEDKDTEDLPTKVGHVDSNESDHVIDNSDHALEVFTFWRDTMKKDPSRTRATPERMKKIKSRLKSYTVDDIKRAIVNCSLTPHNMGQNDRGKQFNDIELICRTDTYLEKFRDSNPVPQRNINSIGTDFSAPEGWNT